MQILEFLSSANPDDDNVLFNLGLPLSEARRLAEAEIHLARAIVHSLRCPQRVGNEVVSSEVAVSVAYGWRDVEPTF